MLFLETNFSVLSILPSITVTALSDYASVPLCNAILLLYLQTGWSGGLRNRESVDVKDDP